MCRLHRRFPLVVVNLTWLLACAATAHGYFVGWAVSLEKLTEEADVIFKGRAVSSSLVKDKSFEPCDGFAAWETQFKVISVVKGQRPGDKLRFRHYDADPQWHDGLMYAPQSYHFEGGRTYLVFAKRGEPAGVVRQLWMDEKTKLDQGVLLCADERPIAGVTVKGILCASWPRCWPARDASDVVYAVGQLDEMSGGPASLGLVDLRDFDHNDALAAVHGLMADRESKIAQVAIRLVGSYNPYMCDEQALRWLATVGSAEAPCIAKMDPKMKNGGGERYWKDLVAVADGRASNETACAGRPGAGTGP